MFSRIIYGRVLLAPWGHTTCDRPAFYQGSHAVEYFAVPEPERGLGATAATFGTLQEDKLVAWMVQYQPYTPLT
ncbi:hypothetical protein CHLRE_16g670652v5 [Chlamydomonas reinhardtii]|uniref:Uncharacterized protein n=1 Tax=Chlamydomonas reinhardtii TaxID=3055 RepID=A0A2K3CU84_CHLRE|nr:uncharacterized protein CHLRE_16g670652v5 [Chlamydomonas reinhardtii]PNW71847.1 hypothetical protein CHLRE_16g670652v5 [Chlamydomonas reinhardtii]